MSVMLDRYRPLFGPETEAGTGETPGGAPPAGGGEGGDRGGDRGSRGRERGDRAGGDGRKSVREELTSQFESARTAGGGDALGSDERADRGDGRDAQGRLLPGNTA